MEKKNNGILIGIIIILIIIVLGLIVYIAYDKGLIFNNKNRIEENNNVVVEKEDSLGEQPVPTDMVLVSSKLNEFGLDNFIMREKDDWNHVNLLSDSSNKFDLLSAYFMKNNLAISSCDDQCAIVLLETYKAKYAEVYGSLDNFEYDINNVAEPYFSIGNAFWNISNDYATWNKVWGVAGPYEITLEATSVIYDKSSNNYVINGNMMATVWDNDKQTNVSIGSKGTFKITYANDGTNKYLTGITISSVEN